MTACEYERCSKPTEARGWCAYHYMRWWKTGVPNPPSPLTMADRLWAKVDKAGPGGCWLWKGAQTGKGYGQMARRDGSRVVHRIAYEIVVGPVPVGMDLDHKCRVRLCVNPAHLEPVTPYENLLRGQSVAAQNGRKTHCAEGHPLSGENLLRRPGGRRCSICTRRREAAWARARRTLKT